MKRNKDFVTNWIISFNAIAVLGIFGHALFQALIEQRVVSKGCGGLPPSPTNTD
jgi:hypothetical protein